MPKSCSRCKMSKPNNEFIKNGKVLLTCVNCRTRGKSQEQPEYYAEPVPADDNVVHFDESETQSDNSQSDSDSDSDDDFVAECKPCGKTYYNVTKIGKSTIISNRQLFY